MNFFRSCEQVTSFLPIRSFTFRKEMPNQKFHIFYLVKSSSDALEDRELRRIAYKIAEVDWESLITELDISTHDAKKYEKKHQIIKRLCIVCLLPGEVKLN